MIPSPHEEFVELCALSTAGELTADEQRRLDRHLAECSECRAVLREFEATVTHVASALAAEKNYDACADEKPDSLWSIEAAEARLMEALDGQVAPRRGSIALKSPSRGLGHLPILAIAAGLLALLPYAAYRIGLRHGRESEIRLAALEKPVSIVPSRPEPPVQRAELVPQASVPAATAATPRIQNPQGPPKEIVLLKGQKRELERELVSRSEAIARNQEERDELVRRLDQSQSAAKELEDKVRANSEQTAEAGTRSQVLTAEVSELHNLLAAKDKEISEERELLAHDRDIRNLMGARDLYIAEIYDVAKSGDIRKPFGRVFYTKDKSLVFYGYDLDRQRGITEASTFQAWGRRGTDPHRDISLGMLFQDDSQKKRWVLKTNDVTTVGQLDAVFVTVEPKGGSAKPTGKPLLFTYLRLSPNHP